MRLEYGRFTISQLSAPGHAVVQHSWAMLRTLYSHMLLKVERKLSKMPLHLQSYLDEVRLGGKFLRGCSCTLRLGMSVRIGFKTLLGAVISLRRRIRA